MTTSPLFKRVLVDATGERLREAAVLIAPLGSMSGPDRWQAAQLMRQAADEIEALKAAAFPESPAEEVETGWQPIETAPKDCTEVLCYVEGFGMGLMVLYWNDGYWREKANGMGLKTAPTHWMPLPPSPSRARAKGGG